MVHAIKQSTLLQRQFKYLRKLKAMKEGLLRRTHKEVFTGTKFMCIVPLWMHRSVIERRLFLFYAAKNYHYPKDHDVAKKFKRKARAALDPSTLPSKELGNKSHVDKHRSYFSKVSIQTMPINEVDRYLAEQSIYVGAKEALRRRVLWEWFNKVGTDDKDTVLTVTPRNKGKINNQFGLRDLILANPTICYSDFMVKFGHQMPTVSRTSFNNARCILRKAGYAMPLLPRGPSRPAIVTDSNGHIQRARPLNTTTIEEPEDGKETTDPF